MASICARVVCRSAWHISVVIALGAGTLAGCSTKRLVHIAGSTCGQADDCAVHSSCARSPDACVCQGGSCYYDAAVAGNVSPEQNAIGCRECHGSLRNAAPPTALGASAATDSAGVGAHQTHLLGGVSSRPVGCYECHIVPAQVGDAGHLDTASPAEVTWGTLAAADGAAPAWDRANASCANVYCHGATLMGAPSSVNATPHWTVVDGSQAACGSCHGLPPAGAHPQSTTCALCHLPMAGPGISIANRATHVDGIVQVAAEACNSCHGGADSAAPPSDTSAGADTTLVGVGAHQAHISGGRLSHAVPCDACHVVPQTIDAPGHIDSDLPAEVVFSGQALADNASPQWDRGAGTCTAYCHGQTLGGGIHKTPQWTVVDGTQAPCGGCHGTPPPLPHVQSDSCVSCHKPTAGPGLTIANRATHIDGVLQAAVGDCSSCHGSTANPAPPSDTAGGSDVSLASVGAHQSHVTASRGLSRPVACSECHVVPVDVADPGHLDTPLPAEMSWGALATADGAGPAYNALALTCSGVYCHGATIAGGVHTTPTWNDVDGSQITCDSCHGLPPGGTHPQNDACELCHQPTAGPSHTIADPTTHIDGTVQAAASCSSCHGGPLSMAPPVDTTAGSATSLTSVGAHQSHLAGGQFSRPVACSECHIVPAHVDDAGHNDTALPAEVAFGTLATTAGSGGPSTPVWQHAGATCGGSYCHGATLSDGTLTTPVWTTVNGTQAACGTCHGMPPGGSHPTNANCEQCHAPTAGPGQTIANRATHVDGILQGGSPHPPGWDAGDQHGWDFNGGSPAVCTTCHGSDLTGGGSGVSCEQCHAGWKTSCVYCHGGTDNATGAPPAGNRGETARTNLAVGAHSKHLSVSATHVAWACTACHVVPTSVLSPGHLDDGRAEVDFDGFSASATYNEGTGSCGNMYCHGTGVSNNGTATWTSTTALTCTSCHRMANNTGEHPKHVADKGYLCSECHANVT
ncbi:MAG: CxxxxCH/CxxCH domain-containing protein, partial [Myxococcota bacterium]